MIITFTVTEVKSNLGECYSITTTNSIGREFNYSIVMKNNLFAIMELITKELNDRGYGVLFEVG